LIRLLPFAAAALIASAANAQLAAGRAGMTAPSRVIMPASSPLQGVIADSPKLLKAALNRMDLPASVMQSLSQEGLRLLRKSPVLVLAVPEAKQAAVVEKDWWGRGAAVSWKNGKSETVRSDANGAYGMIESAAFGLGNEKAAKDALAQRVLLDRMFEGVNARHPVDDVTFHGKVAARDAVALDTQETRGPIRSELRSWNKKTGEMFLAALPRRYHRYTMRSMPLNGKVLVQLFNYPGSVSHAALFSPKTGKLEIFPKNIQSMKMASSKLHPNERQLVSLKDPYSQGRPTIILYDYRAGTRREVKVDERIYEPKLLFVSSNGRYAQLVSDARVNYPGMVREFYVVNLRTGKVVDRIPFRQAR
jgi:hypothetical protein